MDKSITGLDKPHYMWQGSSDLIRNIEGPPMYFDFFHVRYKHYIVKGGYAEMSKLIGGLISAYQAIKPQNKTYHKSFHSKNRFCLPVYVVWRQQPRENAVINDQDDEQTTRDSLWTNCSFNIYTEAQWDFNSAELEFRQSKE